MPGGCTACGKLILQIRELEGPCERFSLLLMTPKLEKKNWSWAVSSTIVHTVSWTQHLPALKPLILTPQATWIWEKRPVQSAQQIMSARSPEQEGKEWWHPAADRGLQRDRHSAGASCTASEKPWALSSTGEAAESWGGAALQEHGAWCDRLCESLTIRHTVMLQIPDPTPQGVSASLHKAMSNITSGAIILASMISKSGNSKKDVPFDYASDLSPGVRRACPSAWWVCMHIIDSWWLKQHWWRSTPSLRAIVWSAFLQERKADALKEGGLVTYKDQMSYGLHIIIVMAVFYIIGHLVASSLSSKTSMVRHYSLPVCKPCAGYMIPDASMGSLAFD